MTEQERTLKTRQAYAEFIKSFPMTAENLDGEEWRAIDGFDGYQVSTCGRVKSLKRGKEHILKPYLFNHYLAVSLQRGDGEQRGYTIHPFVAKAFIPNPENKPEVHHRDDNKFNNAVGNLEWVTHAENVQYAYATGAQKSGGDRSDSDLTNEQVEWCRTVYKPHDKEYSAKALAEKLGVEFETVRLAIRGKTYKNAGGKISENAWTKLSPETRAEIKRRYKKGVKGCGLKALANEFGLHPASIWHIVHDENSTDKFPEPVPEEERREIKRLYVKGSTKFGAVALAKKFGRNRKTITKIVNGK